MFRLTEWFQRDKEFVATRTPRYRRFIKTRFRRVRSQNTSNAALANKDVLDLVTVAFNNDRLIEHQIQLLRENLLDPHHYTVVDNSNQADARVRIEAVCARHGVPYISLPENPYDGQGSLSHGAALNWTHANYLAPRRPRYWGSIDHDLFPVQRTDVIPRLQACGLYGVLHQHGEAWYLWPGFCFFATSLTKSVALNFMPVPGLDTGGGNWPQLYSRISKAAVPTPRHAYLRVREGGNETIQSDSVESLGDWLHMVNGSNWLGLDDNKLELFEALLAKLRDESDSS